MINSYDTSLDEPSPSREELFLERYHRLLDCALKLTNQQRAAAEDLVHDAFIQFMLCRADRIGNIDGYLYGMLRYMRLSQLRRSAQQVNKMNLRIADYDSAEDGLAAVLRAESHAVDSRIRIHDELRRICQYTCVRKETSKSASVLILRFFLGYFPREIAQILRFQNQAVHNLLMIARREVKLFLNTPEQVKFIIGDNEFKICDKVKRPSTGNLLQDLRNTIFRSRRNECLTEEQIQKIYDKAAPNNALDCAKLAHIVSCISCLEEVNRILQLPPIIERFPTDMLDPDSGPDDRDNGSGAASGNVSGGSAISRQRLRRVFEHRPQELNVTVNGFIIGLLKISRGTNELILNHDGDEPVEFIEVFSEQGIRLLFFKPGPSTDEECQRADVELSDGRRLQVDYKPGLPWSSFQIIYKDTELDEFVEPARLKLVEALSPKLDTAKVHSGLQPFPVEPKRSLPDLRDSLPRSSEAGIFNDYRIKGFNSINLRRALAIPWRWFFSSQLWSHPGRVTAFIVFLMAIAWLVYMRIAPPINAACVLAKASSAEEKIDSNPDVIQHRILDFEVRQPADGRVISRRRIEDYGGGVRGVRVRRLYDEKNHLIAGDWRKADGACTLFRRDKPPEIASQHSIQSLDPDEVWRLDLSAREFTTLIKHTDAANMEETDQAYIIRYRHSAPNSIWPAAELIKASITLSKHDLHPVEQTFLIRGRGETREFRFSEASYERLPVNRVSPDIFVPEPELIGSNGATERRGNAAIAATAPNLPASLSAVATVELEVEVIRLLNQVDAFSGDQLSVTRTSDGLLLVDGIIDTDERKQELVRALATVSNQPAIKIKIETLAEVAKRLAKQQSNASAKHIVISEVQVTGKHPPAYPDLRRHFIERGTANDRIDQAIVQFAEAALRRAHRARQHAGAMKQIAVRFSTEQLNTLDEKALDQWRAMIREHAQAFQSEATILRRELEPIFLPINFVNEVQIDSEFTNDADLVRAVGRLFDLLLTIYGGIRDAFSIGSADPAIIEIKLPQFWRSLKSAESLASLIRNRFPADHR